VDERLEGQVWVTVIVTGVGQRARRPVRGAPDSTRNAQAGDELEPPSFLQN
jgi:hypothetical protein